MALILVVEDAWLTRRVICKALQTEGYEILEASNGREGLEIARAQSPECIIVDLLMPELDGLGVLKALQEEELQIPTIVLTADFQESTRQDCLELGAMTVLNKPPNSAQLRAWVEKAVEAKAKP